MKIENNDIGECIREGGHQYFDECRARVPLFIDKHFRHPGAFHTNYAALGWDIFRAPLNLFWAPFYALICLLRYTLNKSNRFKSLIELLNKTPAGFTTHVQTRISTLIIDEILQFKSNNQQLNDNIVKSLYEFYIHQNREITDSKKFRDLIQPIIRDALVQYQVTRTASADIANTFSCTVLGAFAFKKFTPGGIGLGIVIAALLAEKISTNNFIFGATLGEFYYGIFPPTPSTTLLSFSMLGIMTLLSITAAFSGIVTDPVQARLGIHRKRLHKMIDTMENDFIENTHSSFRPKDQFLARILDAFDLIKSSLI